MDAVAVYDILSRRNPKHETRNIWRVVIKKRISCDVLCARNTVYRVLVNMIFNVRDRYENIRVMWHYVDFRLSRSNAQICTHLRTRRRLTVMIWSHGLRSLTMVQWLAMQNSITGIAQTRRNFIFVWSNVL
jgi:hypothetical protein